MRARERGRREEPSARAAARPSRTLPLHAAGAGWGRVSPTGEGGRWPAGSFVPAGGGACLWRLLPWAPCPLGSPVREEQVDEHVLLPPSPRPHGAGGDGLSGSLSSRRWQSDLARRRRSSGTGRRRWRAPRTALQPINIQSWRDARASSAPLPCREPPSPRSHAHLLLACKALAGPARS